MNRMLTVVFLFLVSTGLSAQELDPNTYYLHKGEPVAPWISGLSFGQVELENKTGETVKKVLVATPADKDAKGDAISLKWSRNSVKNEWGSMNKNVSYYTLTNKLKHFDLSSVKDQAALVFDVKIIKAPKKLVELSMECDFNWKCRSAVPLKQAFKKLPKNEWVTIPVPLQCFDQGAFDFSKISSVFMLYTPGKMEIELGDIRLSAFPPDKVKCAGK